MSQVVVTEDRDYIYVQMPYNEDAKDELKKQFGARWDPSESAWYMNADEHDIEDVKKELKVHFPRANL